MSTPSQKSEGMTNFLEQMFGRSTAINSNKCVTCGKDVNGFRDPLSAKEYTISGMCQECQDSVFNVEDDDE